MSSTATINNSQTTTVLDLFQEYKQFYLSQLASETLDKDTKISFMSQVIDNLLEQNENLLAMLLEVQQTAKDRSLQLHTVLERTATQSCKIGHALSSAEHHLKRFISENVPAFIECAGLIGEITAHVDRLEKENDELRKENQSFFKNVQSQSIELMQYKHMVYSLMMDQKRSSLPHRFDDEEMANVGYLELALKRTLSEANETVNTAVCANVLDEIVSAVEVDIERENNIDCLPGEAITTPPPLPVLNKINSIASKTADSNVCDINDNYEFDESTCDSSFVECLGRHDSNYLDYDLKAFRPQVLSLLSILCNELAFKTPVIHELKRQLSHIKSEHLSLHNRHLQLALQVLSTFLHLKEELEAKLESSQMKQKLIEKLDSEMSHVISADSNAFALLNGIPSADPIA